jgi:hypothetical protein
MADWFNGWTLTYAVACAVVLLAIRGGSRLAVTIYWKRVMAWLGLAAVFGLVTWSALACLWMGLFETRRGAWDWRTVPFCLFGSAFWAGFVVAAFVPLYLLLLVWYTRRFGSAEATRGSVILAALWLGLPGALWVAYANAFPVYELSHSVEEAGVYGGLALVSFWIALAAPRLIVRQLGPGQLSERVAV